MKYKQLFEWFKLMILKRKTGRVTIILHEGGIRQVKFEEEIKLDS